MDLVPRDSDRALVGTLHPVEDLHEGRLAGAVLADDRVDLARHHPKVHPVIGHHAWEALADSVQLDGWDRIQLAARNRFRHGHPSQERVRAGWRPGPFRRASRSAALARRNGDRLADDLL